MNVLDELKEWLIDRIRENTELRFHDLDRTNQGVRARTFNKVLEFVKGLVGEQQDEIDKAVNEALGRVEKWVMARQVEEMDAGLGVSISVLRMLEDVGREICRARPKAKREEERPVMVIPTAPKFAKGQVVRVFREIRRIEDAPLWCGVEGWEYLIEKLGWVRESNLSFVYEESRSKPKFKKGDRVTRDGDTTGVYSVSSDPKWFPTECGEHGDGWRYELGGDTSRSFVECWLKAEEHSAPKFKVGQKVRDTKDGMVGTIGAIDKHYRSGWAYWWESGRWEREEDNEAYEEPTTQKVVDEFEIGAGEDCGPCAKLHRPDICHLFCKGLVCGLKGPMRCKECLNKWPGIGQ